MVHRFFAALRMTKKGAQNDKRCPVGAGHDAKKGSAITKNANHKGWRIVLERKTRLELATPTLARSCSTN